MLLQLPVPEEGAELENFKREVRMAKKVNRERHSERCDIELKLSVWASLCLSVAFMSVKLKCPSFDNPVFRRGLYK